MALSLISLLMLTTSAAIVLFYFQLEYFVEQSIAVGNIKNLEILSSSLAALKQNEWEMFGSELSTSARILSDLVSDPEKFLEPAYMASSENYIESLSDLAECVSDECEVDGHVYKVYYKDSVMQDGIHSADWS